MSIQLNLDEMLEVLSTINSPMHDSFKQMIEATGTAMAHVIGQALDCMGGEATAQGVGSAGTCAPFQPHYRGQKLPDAFAGLDEGGHDDWIDQADGDDMPLHPDDEAARQADARDG